MGADGDRAFHHRHVDQLLPHRLARGHTRRELGVVAARLLRGCLLRRERAHALDVRQVPEDEGGAAGNPPVIGPPRPPPRAPPRPRGAKRPPTKRRGRPPPAPALPAPPQPAPRPGPEPGRFT